MSYNNCQWPGCTDEPRGDGARLCLKHAAQADEQRREKALARNRKRRSGVVQLCAQAGCGKSRSGRGKYCADHRPSRQRYTPLGSVKAARALLLEEDKPRRTPAVTVKTLNLLTFQEREVSSDKLR